MKTRANRPTGVQPSKILVAVLLAFFLVSCAQAGTKTTIGAATGAAAGGLIGAAAGGGTAGILGGVLLGGLLGGAVGNALDQRDREYMRQSNQQALETYRAGETSSWSNPDSGNSGSVTPTRTYQNQSGQPCREFTQTVVIGGQTEEAYGTACRQTDGSGQVSP